MINSFKCKETKRIFEGRFSKKLPHDIQRQAERKLIMLHGALDLNDLRIPPANTAFGSTAGGASTLNGTRAARITSKL